MSHLHVTAPLALAFNYAPSPKSTSPFSVSHAPLPFETNLWTSVAPRALRPRGEHGPAMLLMGWFNLKGDNGSAVSFFFRSINDFYTPIRLL